MRRHAGLVAHVKAWAWINLHTSRSRMRYIERRYARRPDLCWCDLADSWWRAEPGLVGDYRHPYGCVCDFPMPRTAQQRPTIPGVCYCPVTVEERALVAEARGVVRRA